MEADLLTDVREIEGGHRTLEEALLATEERLELRTNSDNSGSFGWTIEYKGQRTI